MENDIIVDVPTEPKEEPPKKHVPKTDIVKIICLVITIICIVAVIVVVLYVSFRKRKVDKNDVERVKQLNDELEETRRNLQEVAEQKRSADMVIRQMETQLDELSAECDAKDKLIAKHAVYETDENVKDEPSPKVEEVQTLSLNATNDGHEYKDTPREMDNIVPGTKQTSDDEYDEQYDTDVLNNLK